MRNDYERAMNQAMYYLGTRARTCSWPAPPPCSARAASRPTWPSCSTASAKK